MSFQVVRMIYQDTQNSLRINTLMVALVPYLVKVVRGFKQTRENFSREGV